MNVLIIGTGAIGTMYGWALQNAGHEIVHYVRPGKMHLLKGRTIAVKLRDWRPRRFRGRHRVYSYQVIEMIPNWHEFDLILVPVAHYQVAELLPLLRDKAGKATILFFGNQWDTFETIENVLSGRYLLGFPHHGGAVDEQAVYGMLNRHISLAAPDSADANAMSMVKQLLQLAGFAPFVRPDFKNWCYVHFSWNCATLTESVKQGGLHNYRSSSAAIRDSFLLMQELMEVARAKGADPMRFREGRMAYRQPFLNVLMTYLFLSLPGVADTAALHARTHAEEHRRLYWDMLHSAHQLGVPVPRLASYAPYMGAPPPALT